MFLLPVDIAFDEIGNINGTKAMQRYVLRACVYSEISWWSAIYFSSEHNNDKNGLWHAATTAR